MCKNLQINTFERRYPLGEKNYTFFYIQHHFFPLLSKMKTVFFSLEQMHYNLTPLKAKLEDYTSERRNFLCLKCTFIMWEWVDWVLLKLPLVCKYDFCWVSLNAGWKRISRHRAFRKGVSLLRTKSRNNVGTVSAMGWPPDKPERVDSFYGLVANFYRLKTKKTPGGRLA